MSGAFAGVRVLVVGAGVAGRAAADALLSEGATVVLTDVRTETELGGLADLAARGADLRLGGHDPADLDDADLLVTSPGVPPSAEVLVWAEARGVETWSELELGARLATAPYLAVTGTNGKTTTTGMLAACLRAGGVDAVACGNIGHPFPTAARAGHEALVVEASSFQLTRQRSFHPRVSILLNVDVDHLDHHGSLDAYRRAKAAVYANQGAGDTHVGNAEDPAAAALSRRAACAHRWFGLGAPAVEVGSVGYHDETLVVRTDAGEEAIGPVATQRSAYRADAAAAAAAAIAFGIDLPSVAAGLAAYRPAAHRGEEVARVDGVRFLDDSKATNVHAAAAAIEAVQDAVLIAGGRAKGQDLSGLAALADHLRAVVALGESADAVVATFESAVPVERASSIEEAVRRAWALAGRPGTVLLAPACASWDQFASYVERGDRFAAAARSLGGEEAADG